MGQKYDSALDMSGIEAKVHYLCKQLIELREQTSSIYRELDYVAFSLDVAQQDVRPRDIEEQLPTLRDHVLWAEHIFGGVRPHVLLACAGGEDEHWQIWNSNDMYRAYVGSVERFPAFVVTPEDGVLSPHPDGDYSQLVYYHDGIADFPHGAGASEIGWYAYKNGPHEEPDGPFGTEQIAQNALRS